MSIATPLVLVFAGGLFAAAAVAGYVAVSRAPAAPPEPSVEAPPAALALSAPAAIAAPDFVAAPLAPTFDLVRIAPGGAAVVAGRAEPDAKVTIFAENVPLAEVKADAAGEFVALLDIAASVEAKALTLGVDGGAGKQLISEDVVVLLPAAPEAAAAAPLDAPRIAATAILRDGVAQVALTDGPTPEGLTLASISYAATGAVQLAGLGDAGARVRIYVDDQFARDAAVDGAGRWSVALGDVETGVRQLRLDALRPDGTVAQRIETPFQRDTPIPGAGGLATVTVQPGANLWTLARRHYGAGIRYTQIHLANRALIKDPALIYPGQIFVLPAGDAPTPND